MPIRNAYGSGSDTLILFLGARVGHWIFGWFADVDEQTRRNLCPPRSPGYLVKMLRNSTEDRQSEFPQPLRQVGG